MEYYVYIYLENDSPYYVGMGKDRRYKQPHKYVNVPRDWNNIWMIRGLTQDEAWNIEEILVDSIGMQIENKGPLLNLQRGGKPVPGGWHHAPETKKRISEKLRGVLKTEEHKLNMCKPNTKEHNEKIRLANLGRKDDGRNIKIGKTMSKKRWYNDGSITKMYEPGDEPKGFKPGRKVT